MKVYFVTVRSVTYAQRGERILSRKGISCTVQRTPKWMEEQGCGYCLRIHTGDIAGVLEQLRQEELPIRRVYGQRSGGKLEAVRI